MIDQTNYRDVLRAFSKLELERELEKIRKSSHPLNIERTQAVRDELSSRRLDDLESDPRLHP